MVVVRAICQTTPIGDNSTVIVLTDESFHFYEATLRPYLSNQVHMTTLPSPIPRNGQTIGCAAATHERLAVSLIQAKILLIFQLCRRRRRSSEGEGQDISLKLEQYVWLEKSLTRLLFDENVLFYSDKFGDLRSLTVGEQSAESGGKPALEIEELLQKGHSNNKDSRPLLGHISLMTDFLLFPSTSTTSHFSRSLILTCDRDEKIRISRKKCPFVIDNYLLGHANYISAAVALTSELGTKREITSELVLSGGGDDYLCLWDLAQTRESNGDIIPKKLFFAEFIGRESDAWNVQSLVTISARINTVLLVLEEFPTELFILEITTLLEVTLKGTIQLPIESQGTFISQVVSTGRMETDWNIIVATYGPTMKQSKLFQVSKKNPSLPDRLPTDFEIVVVDLEELSTCTNPTIPCLQLSDFWWRKSSLRKYFDDEDDATGKPEM